LSYEERIRTARNDYEAFLVLLEQADALKKKRGA
jgi:hypothetical protein